MALTAELANQKLEAVEAAIQNLRERRLELLDKDEKDRTGREQAELADYDQQLADLRRREQHWQAEMSKASGPNLKAFRQQRYKRLSVEASCRKYLDALAKSLATFYSFPWSYRQPTIGDVLRAKDGNEGQHWHYNVAAMTHTVPEPDGFQREVKKGAPLIDIPLPQFYTTDEWTKISKFNYKTSARIHDAALPRDSSGRAYVVVHHEDFTEEMRTFLQSIGVRATLLVSPSDLQVKDEADISEGESVVG